MTFSADDLDESNARQIEKAAIRAAEVRGVIFAQEELVRRDVFSDRTLRVLDELARRVSSGSFVSDIYPNSTDDA